MQFHAGHAFKAGKAKINSNRPFLHRHFGIRKRSASLDAKVASAGSAPVRHFLVGCFACAFRTALRTGSSIAPDNAFKPLRSCLFIGEHRKEFNKRKTFSVIFSGCSIHNIAFRSSLCN